MPRYFIEVSYKGTRYSGFQIQLNKPTIQSELQNALRVFYKTEIELTGSSRTDAGVHALQNYFHFDTDLFIDKAHVYNLNAILPADISVLSIRRVADDAHARFHATGRLYRYYIYTSKNPFLTETGWYYPYKVDIDLLRQTACIIKGEHNFQSFSKRNTQVHTFICTLSKADWFRENDKMVFEVQGNRFLRGMVRGLVATQLLVGRKAIDLEGFKTVLAAHDCTKADFSAPAHGLFLSGVSYPEEIFH